MAPNYCPCVVVRRAILIFTVLLTAVQMVRSQETVRPSLFSASDSGASVPASLSNEPGVRRIQSIRMNSGAFSGAVVLGSTVDVLPNVPVRVSWTKSERLDKEGTLLWTGTVEGAPFGAATLIANGNVVTGAITRGDGVAYQIRTAEDGSQWLLEVDQNLKVANDEPLRTPAPTGPVPHRSLAVTDSDDGAVIDVLVLYTHAARVASGGTTQMHQLVSLAVAQTNLAYQNSGSMHRLRLAHVGEVSYTESGDSGDDLTRLRAKDDAFLNDAHTFRDAYQADLVSLWVERAEENIGGRAYLIDPSSPREDYAFSIVVRPYAISHYVFGHEVGHNLGAAHARQDHQQLPPWGYAGAYPYSYGYKKEHGTRFRDIMAYDCPSICPVIPYFSNPDVEYLGSPTGVDENASDSANNVLTFENTRRIVANYRSSGTVSVDHIGPRLTILSHLNNQTVNSRNVILSGTATDAGYGDHGISSVMVNGQRAAGDTAVGSGAANWGKALELVEGMNTIQVVARDNDAGQNASVATIILNYVAAKPSNDSFSNSVLFSGISGTTQGTNIGATAQSGEPAVSTVSNSVWWRWNPGIAGAATIDTEGSDFDTILSVYTGTAVGSLTLVARNDNQETRQTSRVSFTAAAGNTYYIGVTGFDGASGSINLRWLIEGSDAIGPALTIISHSNGAVVSTNLVTLRGTATDAENGGNGVRSVTVNGVRASGGTAAGFGVVNWTATVSLHGGANTIVIVATDNSPRRNTNSLTFTLISTDQSPVNDHFSNATTLTGVSGATTGNNALATLESAEPGGATTTLWWRWDPPIDSTATFDTTGSGFDTVLSVYTGNAVGVLTRVAEDDDGGGDLTSRVSFLARRSLAYFIRVGSATAATGNIALHWSSIGTDLSGPGFTVTSHEYGQVVGTETVTFGGYSDDYGSGSSGISSVTINGGRASGDTATGADTARWSKSVALTPGENLLTIVVRDNSPRQNSTMGSFMINYQPVVAPPVPVSGYAVPLNGVFAVRMDRQPGATLSTGYTSVSLTAGSSPAGLAILSLQSGGTVISETAVPVSRRMQYGSLFVETSASVKTGVAIANPNSESLAVWFRFNEAATGATVHSGLFSIPAHQQVAAFLDDPLFGGPSSMIGTFEFDSTGPVAAIALRGLYNERSEFIMSTTPVVDRLITQEQAETEISHFADGAGWASQVVLFNPGPDEAAGEIRWTSPDGNDVLMDARGQFCPDCPAASRFQYRIPARGAYYLRTSNTSNVLRTGRVNIVPSSGYTPQAFLIFASRNQGITVSEASVTALRLSSGLRLYVENDNSVTTGLAISIGSAEAGREVQAELFDSSGQPATLNGTPLRGTLTVPPNGQNARFLKDIAGFENLPDGFRGVLRLSAEGSFSAIAFRTRINARGDFLMTTTAPVAESDGYYFEEVVFPHLAVGDGFATQLILFSNNPVQATNGDLRTLSREGTLFPVTTTRIDR
jgi:hypothetical protein